MKTPRNRSRTSTKPAIHQRFIDQLEKDLAAITASAKASFAAATDDEHRAEHKYDTFKLEESFLARGQAKRVEELTQALESLRMLPVDDLPEGSPVQFGALVRLKAGKGVTSTLLFGSAAGGETLVVDGEEITVITAQSPLGQALSGKTAGETFDVKIGPGVQTFEIVSVT
jgi:transcription elongation GreA/GreB family factor